MRRRARSRRSCFCFVSLSASQLTLFQSVDYERLVRGVPLDHLDKVVAEQAENFSATNSKVNSPPSILALSALAMAKPFGSAVSGYCSTLNRTCEALAVRSSWEYLERTSRGQAAFGGAEECFAEDKSGEAREGADCFG